MDRNEEFNRAFVFNGIISDIEAAARKMSVVGNAHGIHGDVAPTGEILPHRKGNFSYDPPV